MHTVRFDAIVRGCWLPTNRRISTQGW